MGGGGGGGGGEKRKEKSCYLACAKRAREAKAAPGILEQDEQPEQELASLSHG